MQMLPRPLLRPLPLTSLLVAASLTPSKRHSTMSSYPIKPYTPRHTTNPYTPSDFTRQDPSPDTTFYSTPRFVTHIDDQAITSLREYYAQTLPLKAGKILDFCSSWVSHYPSRIEKAIGLGMNAAELARNPVLTGGRLNANPEIHSFLLSEKCITEEEEGKLDASTNVVSTDYLTQPVAVLQSLREATKTGGTVHLTISNRCFPTKAISRWLRVDEEERLLMVGDFLFFAGWQKIEIVELSDGGGGGGGWMGMGGNRRDPLWVVRAVKE